MSYIENRALEQWSECRQPQLPLDLIGLTSSTSQQIGDFPKGLVSTHRQEHIGCSADCTIRGIYPNQGGALILAKVTSGWNGGAGTNFDDDQVSDCAQPVVERFKLSALPRRYPIPIVKHQNIWSGKGTAMRTGRHLGRDFTSSDINDGLEFRG